MSFEFSEYLTSIIELSILQTLAVISPGPDFAITVRNSLIYSRQTAMITALGVSFGILVHVTYITLGLGVLLSQTAWVLQFLKYAGAAYLMYLGYKGLSAKRSPLQLGRTEHKDDISGIKAFSTGFLTNALNPKAMLFFLSVFTVILSPDTPAPIMLIYAGIIFGTTLVWFSFVAFCFSGKKLRECFSSIKHWIERTTGGLLMLIGIKMLFITQ
jgi:RhtB (resistance to homoserine/threonine) family protein